MSSAVLPALPGVAYPVTRTPVWNTNVMQSISGMETAISLFSYPRWKWELSYDILRSPAAYEEYQTLVGFFNTLQGMFDTFLYTDADDNDITNQQIGIGDGSTKQFQLVRAFGNFVEPILAPNQSTTPVYIYLNGVQQGGGFAITPWGDINPGTVNFTNAPGSGVAITASFNYYWPCRMTSDSIGFGLFMQGMYDLKKLAFQSVKNQTV